MSPSLAVVPGYLPTIMSIDSLSTAQQSINGTAGHPVRLRIRINPGKFDLQKPYFFIFNHILKY